MNSLSLYPTNRPHYGRAVTTLWTDEPAHVLDKALFKDVTDVFLLHSNLENLKLSKEKAQLRRPRWMYYALIIILSGVG